MKGNRLFRTHSLVAYKCAIPSCEGLTRIGYCDTHRTAMHIATVVIALMAFIAGIVSGVALS